METMEGGRGPFGARVDPSFTLVRLAVKVMPKLSRADSIARMAIRGNIKPG